MFYIPTNLQVSQTTKTTKPPDSSFTSLRTYKSLKHAFGQGYNDICFTSLRTYKSLKHDMTTVIEKISFTSLRTYKSLKPQIILLRFSPRLTHDVRCKFN